MWFLDRKCWHGSRLARPSCSPPPGSDRPAPSSHLLGWLPDQPRRASRSVAARVNAVIARRHVKWQMLSATT